MFTRATQVVADDGDDRSEPLHLPLLEPERGYGVYAVYLGERIDARKLEPRLSSMPVCLEHEGGYAVVFRYGAAVLFNLDRERRETLLARLKPLVTQPFADPEEEEADLMVGAGRREGPSGHAISVEAATLGRLLTVAEILAKSVVLAEYEESVGKAFDHIEPLASGLREHGRADRGARQLLRNIGATLAVQHKMVARVEVGEKPELLWENPKLERLYTALAHEYELVERHRALERKLDLISQTVHTNLEILLTKRSLRVEIYILLLIVIEVILSVYGLIRGTH